MHASMSFRESSSTVRQSTTSSKEEPELQKAHKALGLLIRAVGGVAKASKKAQGADGAELGERRAPCTWPPGRRGPLRERSTRAAIVSFLRRASHESTYGCQPISERRHRPCPRANSRWEATEILDRRGGDLGRHRDTLSVDKVSSLLSSRTVFIDSIHRVSTGPSSRSHSSGVSACTPPS